MIISNVGSNEDFARIGATAGWLRGAQLPCSVIKNLYFADQNWKSYRHGSYINGLRKNKPEVATVKDWERYSELETILLYAQDVARYASSVVIIPKVDDISSIPARIGGKQVVLGYSVPSGHGSTSVPVSSFGARPVHLLGGSLRSVVGLLGSSLNVVSLDFNSHVRRARFGWAYTGRDDLSFEYLGRDVHYLDAYARSSDAIFKVFSKFF